jgi:hypothetical protein
VEILPNAEKMKENILPAEVKKENINCQRQKLNELKLREKTNCRRQELLLLS